MATTSGCSINAFTASTPPCTTLKTPSGSSASASSCASRTEADGTLSLGLSTNELPQAIAAANIDTGTMMGKLNGVIPAHTPSGWRNEYVSTPLETCSAYSPLRCCTTDIATSTAST